MNTTFCVNICFYTLGYRSYILLRISFPSFSLVTGTPESACRFFNLTYSHYSSLSFWHTLSVSKCCLRASLYSLHWEEDLFLFRFLPSPLAHVCSILCLISLINEGTGETRMLFGGKIFFFLTP